MLYILEEVNISAFKAGYEHYRYPLFSIVCPATTFPTILQSHCTVFAVLYLALIASDSFPPYHTSKREILENAKFLLETN